ncbi:TIGR02594 family protein [Geomonas paludis]
MAVAMKEIGQKELRGVQDNPRILLYHATTSLHATTDEIAWCSAFVNWCLKQVGIHGTNSAAASSWLHWGKISVPMPGAVTVVKSTTTGENHVAFFISEGQSHYTLLGGNQSHQVRLSNFPKRSYVVLGHRWPVYESD